jgi:probable rRNA maturation factor
MIQVDIDNAVTTLDCPPSEHIELWVKAALLNKLTDSTVAIKIIDEDDMRALNQTYRNKPKTTNVLSFPSQLPEPMRGDFLGDIAICAPVVQNEAQLQNKSFESHFAHLVVHGVLHLLGFDHESDEEAIKMEREEILIMQALGYNDPYLTEITHD